MTRKTGGQQYQSEERKKNVQDTGHALKFEKDRNCYFITASTEATTAFTTVSTISSVRS